MWWYYCLSSLNNDQLTIICSHINATLTLPSYPDVDIQFSVRQENAEDKHLYICILHICIVFYNYIYMWLNNLMLEVSRLPWVAVRGPKKVLLDLDSNPRPQREAKKLWNVCKQFCKMSFKSPKPKGKLTHILNFQVHVSYLIFLWPVLIHLDI